MYHRINSICGESYMTLITKIKDWWAGPPEQTLYNPFSAKVNSNVLLDNELYTITSVIELRGDKYSFSSYYLGDDKKIVVSKSKGKISTVEVDKIDEFGYDEVFHKEILLGQHKEDEKCVDDPNYDFDFAAGNDIFRRVNDIKIPLTCNRREVTDFNDDGKISSNEYSDSQVVIWDYYRATQYDEAEFLFVEMNNETGYFQLWRGLERNPDYIKVI